MARTLPRLTSSIWLRSTPCLRMSGTRTWSTFADRISDEMASDRLKAALQGRGAFRRFKNQIYEHHPALISPWQALRDVRAQRRAVEWLLEQGLIDDRAARQFAGDHPDPALPSPFARKRSHVL